MPNFAKKVHPALIAMMKRFDSGYSYGVRVNLGLIEGIQAISVL